MDSTHSAKKRGRAQHKPTEQSREIVEALSGYGIPADKISAILRITKPTLLRRYRKELDRGASVVEGKLIGNLMRLANGKDGTALKAIMFSLSCRFGWSQYAPPPAEPRPEPLGKKETLAQEARTGHEGTSWGEILH